MKVIVSGVETPLSMMYCTSPILVVIAPNVRVSIAQLSENVTEKRSIRLFRKVLDLEFETVIRRSNVTISAIG